MKRKLAMFVVALSLVFILTGCGDYNAPIHDSVGWYEKITVVPLGYVLQFFAGLFNNSFAAGIIFTTICVRTIAWPIYAKSNDFTMKMQLMNPEMQKLQAKYVTRKDPESQQKQQLEMMALYKKYGISPMGCLYPFLQMPIFMAMYATVQRIPIQASEDGSLQSIFFTDGGLNQSFFGAQLSGSAFGNGFCFQIFILGLLVGGTMFLLQFLSTKKPAYAKNIPTPPVNNQSAQMQKMMKVMNIVMIVMMTAMSFGSGALAFYWVIGNVYSILQNLINRYLSEKKFNKLKEKTIV